MEQILLESMDECARKEEIKNSKSNESKKECAKNKAEECSAIDQMRKKS